MSILKKWKRKEIEDWIKDLDESKKTLYGVILNIIMFSVIELIIGLFLVNKYINFILGIVLGTIVAILMIRNMYSVIDRAVMENEETAEGIMRKASVIRMLCLFIVFVIAVFLNRYINVYAMAISTFNLKLAAYIVPFTNKYIFTRYVTKGR